MKLPINVTFEFKDWGHWLHVQGDDGLIMSIPEYKTDPSYFNNWYNRGLGFIVDGLERLADEDIGMTHEVYQEFERMVSRLTAVKEKQHKLLCRKATH